MRWPTDSDQIPRETRPFLSICLPSHSQTHSLRRKESTHAPARRHSALRQHVKGGRVLSRMSSLHGRCFFSSVGLFISTTACAWVCAFWVSGCLPCWHGVTGGPPSPATSSLTPFTFVLALANDPVSRKPLASVCRQVRKCFVAFDART